MKRMPANKLILDSNLYPRKELDQENLERMRRSLKAGAKFPPVLVAAGSRRVVDGFHRVTVFRELSKIYQVEVVEKRYKGDAEMFADAIRMNSAHGKNLTVSDQVHCRRRAEKLSLAVGELASALCMTVEAVGELRVEKARKPGRPKKGESDSRLAAQSSAQRRHHPLSGALPAASVPRAKEVLNDIAATMGSIAEECDRIGILGGEARARAYWKALFDSEGEWLGTIAIAARRIRETLQILEQEKAR